MPKSCPTEPVAGRPRDKAKTEGERWVRDGEREGGRRREDRDHIKVTEKGKTNEKMLEMMQTLGGGSGWVFINKRKEKQKDKKKKKKKKLSCPSFSSTS